MKKTYLKPRKEDFNNNLKRLMKREKMTIDDLATALAVSHSSVERWRRDKYPSCYYLARMCRVLRCTADELIFEKENEDVAG